MKRTILSPRHYFLVMMTMMIRTARAWTGASHRQSALCLQTPYMESLERTTLSSSSSQQKKPYKLLWDENLPVGARCVGLQLEESTINDDDATKSGWRPSLLHPLEIEYGQQQLAAANTRQSFFLGRLALRHMIDTAEPMLKDSYGRPQLPAGYVASISHKANVGVALVQQQSGTPFSMKDSSLGVDLEFSQLQGHRKSVARKVLTRREQENLGQLPVR